MMRQLWMIGRVEFSELLFRLAWRTFPSRHPLYVPMTLAIRDYHEAAIRSEGRV
jgi:hypothetical protein